MASVTRPSNILRRTFLMFFTNDSNDSRQLVKLSRTSVKKNLLNLTDEEREKLSSRMAAGETVTLVRTGDAQNPPTATKPQGPGIVKTLINKVVAAMTPPPPNTLHVLAEDYSKLMGRQIISNNDLEALKKAER